MKKGVKLNFLFPLATGIMAVVWLYLGITEYGLWDPKSASPKDGFFPVIIAAVLLLSSVLNFISSFKEKNVTFEPKALILAASLAAMYWGCSFVGMIPTLMIFYVLWLKLFAKVDWKTTIISSLCVFAIVYFGFAVGLKIRFPQGVLMQMFK